MNHILFTRTTALLVELVFPLYWKLIYGKKTKSVTSLQKATKSEKQNLKNNYKLSFSYSGVKYSFLEMRLLKWIFFKKKVKFDNKQK